VATKQLLETLTQWSRQQATDAQVSDVYVRLGYEFNIACRAFTAINVDTSDLGNVPELLRHILESTLSQEASVESLDKYLPRIRDIIINLLHGLKRKQSKLRQKSQTQKDGDGNALPRNGSVSSVGSANSGLTTLLNEGLPEKYRTPGAMDIRDPAISTMNESFTEKYRQSGMEIRDPAISTMNENAAVPPRGSSSYGGSPNRRAVPQKDSARGSSSSEQSTLSSNTMQSMPVMPPYPGDEIPMPPGVENMELNMDSFPPPPPPPKATNALAALQRGGDLERRASRRYSQYQISKHLGASPNGVPMLPPTQNSPIPNRGRDARESLNAVRTRGSIGQNRQKSNNRIAESSPSRAPSRIPEESFEQAPELQKPAEPLPDDSPIAKTPEDKLRPTEAEADLRPSATLQGPPTDLPTLPAPVRDDQMINGTSGPASSNATVRARTPETSGQHRQFIPDQSPQPEKELTLFLQYKTKIKKFVLADGYNGLSIARLQLAFIEKFAWNTQSNGNDLPEIYIQDPVSGVRHELEDLSDIKERSVLVLNVEVLDEVKRHIDEGMEGLKKMVEGVKTAVDDQQASLQRVSDRQQDAAKEIARLATAPPPPPVSVSDVPKVNGTAASPKVGSPAQLAEIQSLRRDLAVLRQTYSSFQSDIQSSMSTLRTKAASIKATAIKASIPDLDGDTGRSYVNAGKKSLNEDSDKLVGRVDDLQDIVEDLRKDVVLRGVRPLPRQLETVAKDISLATQDLKKMQDFLKRERPIWTKIWEKELQTVCNDREEMTMQEDLAADLEDDLEKATETFALVEQATKEQLKDNSTGQPRIISKGLNQISADPTMAKEGVLGEVRALQPNHENRLEAIERAEKLRQKELESRRGGEFQKELGTFVEEGKLKKAGGFEEAERLRKAKDERIRREVWERQNGMTQADALQEEPAEAEEAEEEAEGEEEEAAAAEAEGETENEAEVEEQAEVKEADTEAAPGPTA
jgi:hypothetical protein